jgi:uncharacterized protein (DUF58 family)
MIPEYVKAFTYSIPWKSSSVHFGDHRGTQRGLGNDYRGNVSLVDYPDARRMDLRESMRDPYEQIQIKTFNQNNTTPIYALCDVSSSMQFSGKQRKLDIAKEIAASVAYSAYEMGDVFSFIAYNDHVIEDLTLPLSHQLHHSLEVISQLADYETKLTDSQGVKDVPFYLSPKRSLVFWISDFHMPLEAIERTLNGMATHQVVPIILWDEKEYKQLPSFGFGNMIDPETGASRTYFFRKNLREQFIKAFEDRREALAKLFNKFDYTPLYLDQYTPEAITHYFEEYMNL